MPGKAISKTADLRQKVHEMKNDDEKKVQTSQFRKH